MPEQITMTISGKKFSGWTGLSITRSIETLTGFFSFQVTDQKDQRNNLVWPLQTQEPVIIKVGDIPIINGYIYTVNPSITASTHTITISGRDKTGDLVDTSAEQSKKKFTLTNTNILKLAEVLIKPYGIQLIVSPGTDVTKKFSLTFNASESPFEILNKRAREAGLLLITDTRGRLVLTNSGNIKTHDPLVLGKNVISGKGSFDYSDRFSKYIVFSQNSSGEDWGSNINVAMTADDPNVKRFRPLIIQAESQMTKERAQIRANWEANVRAARSQEVILTVQDFVQSNGKLWDINQLVSVLAPALYINPALSLLITTVNYEINSSGSFTHISLKRPDAYIAEPLKKVKTQNNLGW